MKYFYVISPRGITRLRSTEVPGNIKTIGSVSGCVYNLRKDTYIGVPNSNLVLPMLEDKDINVTTPVQIVTEEFLNLIRQEYDLSI